MSERLTSVGSGPTVLEPPRQPEQLLATTSYGGVVARHWAALRAMLVLTVLLGLVYPLAITAVAHIPGLSHKAEGSLVSVRGQVVGSSLLAQGFVDGKGNPLPIWFQPRPSAAGTGWDPTSSRASNLGPSNPKLVALVNQRRAAVAAFDTVPGHRVDPAAVPVDAVTASGSGLDPDISPAYAREQAYRVAAARDIPTDTVLALVAAHTHGRDLGFLGEPVVDVVTLNAALAALPGAR